MTRAVDHATGRRFDPFTDQSTVIAIKGVAVAPMPMTPTVIGIAYPDANAARTGYTCALAETVAASVNEAAAIKRNFFMAISSFLAYAITSSASDISVLNFGNIWN